MEKAKQHIISKSYLSPWCDPDTPEGYEPYVWVHKADGSSWPDGSSSRRKAPGRSFFCGSDRYTVKSPDGDRDLAIEDTLGGIEGRFVEVRENLERRHELSHRDRFALVVFVAAMCSRTKAAGDNWTDFFRGIGRQRERLAKERGSPGTPAEDLHEVRNANALFVQATLQTLPQMLFPMSLAILVADGGNAFITSDHPCVWFNPKGHLLPPGLRSPTLGDPWLEITLPVSPRLALILSWRKYTGYQNAGEQLVASLNRRTRFQCKEYFVTQSGNADPYWFQEDRVPEDAWENSPEGKASMNEMELDRRYEESLEGRERS